jgi:hypothetical protein
VVRLRLISEGEARALRVGLGAPVPPRGERGSWGEAEASLYQAALIADQNRLGLLELAAAMDLECEVSWQAVGGDGLTRSRTALCTLRGAIKEGDLAVASWIERALTALDDLPVVALDGARRAYRDLEKSVVADAAGMVRAVREAGTGKGN